MEKETIQPAIVEDHSEINAFPNGFNERSELAQEVISRKPDFLEKWALLIYLCILLLILCGTWFIKYPDFIESKAILTSGFAPKEIMAKQSGRIVRLFVKNNEQLKKDDIIGWIESTADHLQILDLSKQIESSEYFLNTDQFQKVSTIFKKRHTNLGEVQPDYQQFIAALQQYNDYKVNGFYQRKKESLEHDINSIDKAEAIIQGQKKLTEQDLKLAEESYKMNKKLLDQNVLTQEEFRSQTSKYVNKQLAIPQFNASLISNQTQKREKLKEVDQLDHDLEQQKITFEQTLQSLKSKVDDWRKKYTLQSPISGKVSFVIPLQENQYIQEGKVLGYIIPSDTNLYVESYLSQHNFGKVDTGLSVQLRFEAYPYQEVGFVEGKINYISNVPSDSGFLATIKLSHGLKTNGNNTIAYKNGLKATAIIITKNMRLMERLYYDVVKSTSVGTK